MRSRTLLVVAALALPVASISCPWTDDATPLPAPEPPLTRIVASAPPTSHAPTAAIPVVAARPAASPGATSASASPAAPISLPGGAATKDPGLLATLPPELVDDGSDDVKDDEPAPPPRPEIDELASTAKETWVFAEPHWKARRLGYLRAGALVQRRAEPVTRNHACPDAWYRIEPRGYVCVGSTATLNVSSAVVETSAKRPRRDGLPYTYVMSRFPTPTFYARLPSATELAKVEPDIKAQLRRASRMTLEPDYVAPPSAESVPGVLLYGRSAPALGADHRSPSTLTLGHAVGRSGFALLSTFDYEDRRYGLTTELAVLPIDRTRVVKESSFSGLALDDATTLPVAFVRSHHATRFVAGPGGALIRDAAIAFREAVPITGEQRRVSGEDYLVARDGTLIPAEHAVRVDKLQNAPAWSSTPRRWIDVSILHQSLVAYEGRKPIYVTLVSTGADGLGDPKTTHSTIQGAFLIHTKHVSITMGDHIADEFDFRDVPFVQYFTEGFALHAAYWHDEFGTPRSHGCVNLSPKDAAWLFNWTDPEVPPAWHGALSLRKGTLVYIHP
jgi:hypothetical protein